MTGWRCCGVVPTFDNPRTVRQVVTGMRAHGLEVVLVDDGSGPEGKRVCEQLGAEGLAVVHRLAQNGGKGKATKRGLAVAAELGYSHAFQVDADGQHDLAQMPVFLEASRQQPEALVLGYPHYDASIPNVRRVGRKFMTFWVGIEVGGRDKIKDAMIGFRVYPLAAVQRLRRLGNRMDFDIEIAVRLCLLGIPVLNLPVPVRYLAAAEGGVSHFRPWHDNLLFCWLHSRLCTAAVLRWTRRLAGGTR